MKASSSSLLVFSLSILQSHAASDTVDSDFAMSAGQIFKSDEFGGISSSIVQPDGKVIFGSNEMPGTVEGTPFALPLIRINPDGTVDSTFGADNHPTGGGTGIVFFASGWPEVHDLAIQADGKIIAAGVMEGYSTDGSTITHGGRSIVRLNADGTPDPTFTTNGTSQAGGFNFINDVDVQGDGKIIAAGGFSGIQNSDGTFSPRKGIVRFNTDGSVDPTFAISPGHFGAFSFSNGFCRHAEISPGGEIYAMVSFDFSKPDTIARLRSDGSRDTTFAPIFSGDRVISIHLDSASRLLVVGSASDNTIPVVERFLSSGLKDSTFTLDPSLGVVNSEQLEESPTGQYYLTTDGGAQLVRINSDGSLDPTFNASSDHPDAPAGPDDGFLRAITISPDGSVYSGSFFSSVNTISTRKIVKFEGDPSATSDIRLSSTSITTTESDRTLTLSATRTGDLSAPTSTSVTISGGTAGASDFSSSSPFTLNWPAGVGGKQFFTIDLLDDALIDGEKTILLDLSGETGTITILDDEAPPTIADPPADFTAISGQNATFSVVVTSPTAVAYQWKVDGVDVTGSTFPDFTLPSASLADHGAQITVTVTNAAGSTTSTAATLTVITPDGSRDFSFPGDLATVPATKKITPAPDGSFILLPSESATPQSLYRLLPDGTTSALAATFTRANGQAVIIDSIAVQPDGKILVIGFFDRVDGISSNGFARLTAEGQVDLFFQPEDKPLGPIFVNRAGQIFALFSGSGDDAGLRRLLDDGSLDPSFRSQAGVSSRFPSLYDVTEDSSGRLYVAYFNNNNPNGFATSLVRVLPSGEIDPTFIAAPLPGLTALTVLSSDRIAVASNQLVSVLREDGTPDPSFNLPSELTGSPTFIYEDRGGLIVNLTSGEQSPLRLFANGSIDPSFPPADGGGVIDLIPLGNGNALAALSTTTFNGGPTPSLISLIFSNRLLEFANGGTIIHEDAGTLEVTLNAFGDLSTPLTSTVTSVDGSGMAGTDFVTVNESLTFDSANPSRTITVTLTDDALENRTRDFQLQLSSPDLTSNRFFNVTLLDDETAPVFTQQPADLAFFNGENTTLSLTLENDTGATIQWFRNSRPLSGATSATYQTNQAGSFFAEVTRNGVTVTSDIAIVSSRPSPSAPLTGYGFTDPLKNNPIKVVKTGPLGAGFVGAEALVNGSGALWRILPNATADPAWAPIILGTVQDLVVEPSGAVVIVGDLNIQGDNPVVTTLARYLPDGTRDTTFPTATETISHIKRYQNGDLLIGGSFNTWAGGNLPGNNSLVKLDASGNRLTDFAVTRSGTLSALLPLPDGGVLLNYSGSSTIFRLDATGATVDSGNVSGNPLEISSAPEGKFLVVTSSTSSNVFRLASDLSVEQTFPINKATTAAAQANGKVIVGGTFISQSRRKIARFLPDGTIDPDFSTANGLRTFAENDGNFVTALNSRPDGSFWIGGTFPGYGPANQVNRANLALINADPIVLNLTSQPSSRFVENGEQVTLSVTVESEFTPTFQWFRNDVAVDGETTANLVLDPPVLDGSYHVVVKAGPAETSSLPAFIGVKTEPKIRLLSEGGTFASGLPLALQVEAYGQETLSYQWLRNGNPISGETTSLLGINALELSDNGSYSVRITNALGTVTSDSIELVILLNGAAVADGFTSPQPANQVNTLLPLPGNRVLVGGAFFNFRNSDFTVNGGSYLAVMQSDGTVIPDHGLNINNQINALAAQPDGKIIIAGRFSQVGGMPRKQLARLNADLTLDESFDPGETFPGFATINQIGVDPDGKILVAHSDFNLKYLTRLLTNGAVDSNFQPTATNTVNTIITLPDGTYLIGGNFSNWDGMGATTDSGLVNIANDGTLIATPDFIISNSRVQRLFALDGGDLFASYQNGLAEVLGTDGLMNNTRFSGFTPNGIVNDLQEDADGNIYLGGGFTTINGNAASRLLRTDTNGVIDPSFDVGTGFNNQIQSLLLNEDGTLWVAGRFTQYNGQNTNYLTLLNGSAEPPSGPTFANFISDSSLPADQQDRLDNPDGDDFSNELEYLLDGNPATFDQDLLSQSTVEAGDMNDYFAITFTISDEIDDIAWSVKASEDLIDFTTDAVLESSVSNGNATTYTYRLPWPLNDPRGSGLLRIQSNLN